MNTRLRTLLAVLLMLVGVTLVLDDAASDAAPARRDVQTLRVATYNVLYTNFHTAEGTAGVHDSLNFLMDRYDVIGLQEALSGDSPTLIRNWAAAEGFKVAVGTEGTQPKAPILYRAGLDVGSVRYLKLNEPYDAGTTVIPSLTATVLSINFNGRTIRFANVHPQAIGGRDDLAELNADQIRSLNAQLDDFSAIKIPLGDWNRQPASVGSLGFDARGYVSVQETFGPFLTSPSRSSAIDDIWATHVDNRIEPVSARTHELTSDHLALGTTFVVYPPA